MVARAVRPSVWTVDISRLPGVRDLRSGRAVLGRGQQRRHRGRAGRPGGAVRPRVPGRRRSPRSRSGFLVLTTVAVMIVTNKTLSPQYLLWLGGPAAALLLLRHQASDRDERPAIRPHRVRAAGCSPCSTHLVYPLLYDGLLGRQGQAMIVVATVVTAAAQRGAGRVHRLGRARWPGASWVLDSGVPAMDDRRVDRPRTRQPPADRLTCQPSVAWTQARRAVIRGGAAGGRAREARTRKRRLWPSCPTNHPPAPSRRTSAPTTGCWRRCTSSTPPTRLGRRDLGRPTSRPTVRRATANGQPTSRPAGARDRGQRRRPAAQPRRAAEPAAHRSRPGPGPGPGRAEGHARPRPPQRPETTARRTPTVERPTAEQGEPARPAPAPAAACPPTRPTRRTGPNVVARGTGPDRAPGAPARTAKNMDISLTVPTATSVRSLPVKLLIDQRVVINNHLRRARGGKVSYTHLIGYAMVQALKTHPEMNNGYESVDGKPTMVVPAPRQPRPGHRPAQARRHPAAAGAEHQELRDAGLRPVLGRVRADGQEGPGRSADRRGLRRHHHHADQPGHHRHQPLGAAADAGPGRDHRRRLDGVPAGVPGLRPRQARRR